MQVVRLMLRDERQGAASVVLALALVGIVAAGVFVIAQTNEFKLEGRLHDVGYFQDPVPAEFDAILTNVGSEVLLVDHVKVKVWADASKHTLLTEAEVRGIQVQPGETVTRTLHLDIHNGSSFGSSVWVEAHMTYYYGTHRNEWSGTKQVSVDGILARFR